MPDPVDPFALDGVDELFTLEPAAFTAARNALAKALKAGGDKPGGTAVAALRRPSATAWALNQVARTEDDLVEDALEAGADLRAATDAAMAGDNSALREATATDRAASTALVQAALDVLGGGAAGAEAKLAATVRAAVLDDDVADQLRRGILQVDHDRSGLGLGAELDAWVAPARRHLHVVPDPEPEPEAAAEDDAAPRKGRSLKERRAADKAAKARAAEAAEAQARAEAERRTLRRRVNELRTAVRAATKRAERLERDAEEAEATAAEARELADGAAAEAAEAGEALAAAQAELDEA